MTVEGTAELMLLPVELIGMITSYAGSFSYDERIFVFHSHRKTTGTGERERETLASLRLVNQTFCRDATPLLFKHIFATSRNGWCNGWRNGLTRLYHISDSPLARYVEHIDIGSASHPDNVTIGTQYANGFDDLLFQCLVRLPNLRSLDFAGGRFYSSFSNDSLVYSLRNYLLYIDSPALRELDIACPSSDSSGASGIWGSRCRAGRRRGRAPDTEKKHGSTITPICPPNPRYFEYMTGLLELAENLQSLALRSTEALNIGELTVPGSWHLRSLSLTRISFSAEKIGALVHQSYGCLESIELLECELTAGSTWEGVLGRLCELPRLISFQMQQCGYATTDDSIGPALDYILKRDDQPIETYHVEDQAALGRLKFHVNANRVASGLRPRTWRL
ncbi:uncharacterized protein PG998_010170 [Apiospora kogelbergensis]|uniref:uncharacterized protein n=1 Tax=Apiospora kogelbergensis TaxID=1337665 RepID=UPI00312EAA1A